MTSHLTIRYARTGDIPALAEMSAYPRDVWDGAPSKFYGWLIAHLDGAPVGCINVLPGWPVARIESPEHELGGLSARMGVVESEVRALRGDMAQLLGIATATRLGWKVLLSVAAISAMLGTLVSNAVAWLSVLPR